MTPIPTTSTTTKRILAADEPKVISVPRPKAMPILDVSGDARSAVSALPQVQTYLKRACERAGSRRARVEVLLSARSHRVQCPPVAFRCSVKRAECCVCSHNALSVELVQCTAYDLVVHDHTDVDFIRLDINA